MLLLNYDFYDIYAVLISFRNDPSNTFNEKIAKTIKALLESPQVDNLQKALRMEARKDAFLAKVLECAETQRFMVNKAQQFTYCEFPFTLDTRCKWDWWLGGFGGDLKTTFAATQQQFEEAVDFFDWDRSRAWYMDIAKSNRDFIYAISKKNCCIFKKFINRGDEVYNRGREKYEELAFQYWCLTPQI